jgi:hypothetical protein
LLLAETFTILHPSHLIIAGLSGFFTLSQSRDEALGLMVPDKLLALADEVIE